MAIQTPNIRVIKPKGGFAFQFPKISPVFIILGMIIMAGAAIGSAVYLYLNRNKSVSPTAPTKSFAATTTTFSDNFNNATLSNSWGQAGQVVIQDNPQQGGDLQLRISIPTGNTASSLARAYYPSDSEITGDFTAEVDLIDVTDGNSLVSGIAFGKDPTTSASKPRIERYTDPADSKSKLTAYIGVNPVTVELPNTGALVRVKLIRIGSTIQAFYDWNRSGNYLLLASNDQAYAGDGNILLYVASRTPNFPGGTARFNDFSAQVNLLGLPPAPTGSPEACTVNFTVGATVATPVPTIPGQPTPTPVISCNSNCASDNQCQAINSAWSCVTVQPWAGNPVPLANIQSFDRVSLDSGTTYRATIFQGDRLWQYTCNLDGSGCRSSSTVPLTTSWGGLAFDPAIPTNNIDAFDRLLLGNGTYRATVIKGDRLWQYTCNLDGNGCQAGSTVLLSTAWGGLTFDPTISATAIPTRDVDAFDRLLLGNGTYRATVIKGDRLWQYTCNLDGNGCHSSLTMPLASAWTGLDTGTNQRCRLTANIDSLTCQPAGANPTATPTPTTSPTSTYCGMTASSNLNCPAGSIYYQGFCRNPQCPSASDCVCTTVVTQTETQVVNNVVTFVPTPTPIVLTQAGSTTGTWILTIGGIFLLATGGILLLGL